MPQDASPHPDSTWEAIAADPDFHALQSAKRRFIIPGTIFFMLYYLALPVLVGFFPELMKKQVIGAVNLAYLFALSQFAMTWILCGMYVHAARRWDAMNKALLAKFNLQ